MAEVHQIAQKGFGVGTNDLYDRARPSYQTVALEHIRQSLSSETSLNILEIGSGTGIFTRALLADSKWNAAIGQYKAIEPSEGMRGVFTRTISDPRVSVSEGVFQTTGIQDGWADLVVIAQAFHWCPDYNAASAEFARVLKPNGVLALIWNLEDRDKADWVAKVRDVYETHEKGTPQFRLMLWRQTFDIPAYQQNFKVPEEHVFGYTLQATKDSVVDRVLSKSYITLLTDDQKAEVRDATHEVLDKSEKTWVDKEKGVFEYPYKTWVVLARKK